uniref:Uncharacterized protein n=1 Tax=viral metagenome TaxID=1070528 RepID=A0A6C0DAK8_9ZZZZ
MKRYSRRKQRRNKQTRRVRFQLQVGGAESGSLMQWLSELKQLLQKERLQSGWTLGSLRRPELTPAPIDNMEDQQSQQRQESQQNITHQDDVNWKINTKYFPSDIRILISAVRNTLAWVYPDLDTYDAKRLIWEQQTDASSFVQLLKKDNEQLYDMMVAIQGELEKRFKSIDSTYESAAEQPALIMWALANLAISKKEYPITEISAKTPAQA